VLLGAAALVAAAGLVFRFWSRRNPQADADTSDAPARCRRHVESSTRWRIRYLVLSTLLTGGTRWCSLETAAIHGARAARRRWTRRKMVEKARRFRVRWRRRTVSTLPIDMIDVGESTGAPSGRFSAARGIL